MYRKLGFTGALALSLAACGSNITSDDAGTTTPGPDAADTAVTPPPADPYVWVVVQDTEQVACTTNGPGADIDAVAMLSATGDVLGWGMVGSASYTANPAGNACANTDCASGNCKYAAISKTFTQADLVARTEGPNDAQINTGDDVGYFSLNAGTLQIQIGNATTGAGPARAIKSGDWIVVYEVDKTYVGSGDAATCTCLPEHYEVYVQTADPAKPAVKLKPSRLDPANSTCSALTAASTEGCGTTVFAVP